MEPSVMIALQHNDDAKTETRSPQQEETEENSNDGDSFQSEQYSI